MDAIPEIRDRLRRAAIAGTTVTVAVVLSTVPRELPTLTQKFVVFTSPETAQLAFVAPPMMPFVLPLCPPYYWYFRTGLPVAPTESTAVSPTRMI
jgi:hypothetical protein